ncbi:hypothetical protein C3Y87_10480 [Carbonactinospora thermoautotrophica]|uniref:Uncharacterized protein n=1 Tax=Carbonactinospora thermoautotrophica TaxID=1469144 RepID=A0A132N360_9ACTN|nr:hypothetical protein [Carbonactinospora thermoautotrophica]KWW99595.1 hypothetical protein LI90_1231 [Carbonactinospora thermoautotrophica]KWX04022.1 hypothetical protein TH66_08705 [Carbonactinospora thermoautotrophica]KWX10226.1 hypothetical protein TR74_04905 [Carbonactinospora thermoautotrophica]MCX9191833.1 hypothetical protein [Carbonactinospora thermoautotrophica]
MLTLFFAATDDELDWLVCTGMDPRALGLDVVDGGGLGPARLALLDAAVTGDTYREVLEAILGSVRIPQAFGAHARNESVVLNLRGRFVHRVSLLTDPEIESTVQRWFRTERKGWDPLFEAATGYLIRSLSMLALLAQSCERKMFALVDP